MIKEIVQKWDENKDKLEEFYKSRKQSEYNGSYQEILKSVFNHVIDRDGVDYDFEKTTIVDDGNWQGTQIFLTPRKTYQPSVDEYLITHTYYGSCSGCDTLQAISSYEDGIPSDDQVSGYMTLALHLIQKMTKLKSEFDSED